jgi:hypothetical protein
MRPQRYTAGSFWTPERDARLQRLEAEGLSGAKIAERLGTTRNAVIGRSSRLRGLFYTFPSYLKQKKEAQARSVAFQKERKRLREARLAKLRQDLARGVARNTAIAAAVKSGLPYQAVGDVFGLTRERIRQIANRYNAKSRLSARIAHEASRRGKGAAR